MGVAQIGQVVRYQVAQGAGVDDARPGWMAAVITMTPQEWSPGYFDADGCWYPTTNVQQPKPGTVHLHVFPPPGPQWPTEDLDVSDVPWGTDPGCWSYITPRPYSTAWSR